MCGPSKRVLSHSQNLFCTCCEQFIHRNCLIDPSVFDSAQSDSNFMCSACMSIEFPFNNLDDDNEFLHIIQSFNADCKFNIANLHSDVFNAFDSNDLNTLLDIDDIDPDFQFYNDHLYLNNIGNCNYYTENKFVSMFRKLSENHLRFSIINFNIRSMCKNLNNFQTYLYNIDFLPTVLSFTETWLKESTQDIYNIDGYNIENQYRKSQTGGGVSLLMKDNIEYTRREDLCQTTPSLETLFVEISNIQNTNSKHVMIGVIYRPPNTDINLFLNEFNVILHKIKLENKIVYLTGDFNINLLNAASHLLTEEFLELMYSYSFLPLINRPTRVTNNTATLIDNIWVNEFNENLTNGIFYTDITDHFLYLLLTVNSKLKQKYSLF
jgi:hypothetical protein